MMNQLTSQLSNPFPLHDVKFKPQSVKGNRALALAYVDARAIQDRLDSVLGVEGWQDEYELMPDGSVLCKLRLKMGDDWIVKMDVGSPSAQPDVGDRLKAAFSDALKRAAVKFGIGRYLYRLPAQWVDYDPQKRQIVSPPRLPAFAQPQPQQNAAQPKPVEVDCSASNLPSNGKELHQRLRDYDAKLASSKKAQVGALLSFVAQEGEAAGYSQAIETWDGPAIEFAVEAVKRFQVQQRKPKPQAMAA